MIFATGWASVAATYRDLERTETAEKIKESTVNIIDKSMDGLSKVCMLPKINCSLRRLYMAPKLLRESGRSSWEQALSWR